MNDKIRQAFDQVQAENELKDKTKDFIFQKDKKDTNRQRLLISNTWHRLLRASPSF